MATKTIPPKHERRDYYVYVLFRRDNGQPFYIGYGKGRRWLDHEQEARCAPGRHRRNNHKINIILSMLRDGLDVPKIKIAEHLNISDAQNTEKAFIAAIGRYPNGPLVNLTDGGEGVPGLPEGTRQKFSASNRGKIPTPEHRAKISAGIRNALSKTDPDILQDRWDARIGRIRSIAAIEKTRAALIGVPHSPERRAANSAGQKKSAKNKALIVALAELNRGSTWSDEQREKILEARDKSEACKNHMQRLHTLQTGRKRSDETKAKISAGIRRWLATRPNPKNL